MEQKKSWKGYTSWSYLKPNVDFLQPSLEKQRERFRKYDFGLSKTQEERVEQLVRNNIIIDLHEHLNVFPQNQITNPQRREFKAYEGLAYSDFDVVFEHGIMSHPTEDNVINFLGMSQADYAHQDFIIPALKKDDLTYAHNNRKVAVILSIESLTNIRSNLDKVDLFYGLGLRAAGLVYTQSNSIGTGQNEQFDGGLTDFGYDVVKRMNATGIIVDVSHCSDKTALQAAETSNKPIVANHSGARKLTHNSRMSPDEVLLTIAENGGVIGVEAAGFAPRTKKHPAPTIECTLDHIKYLLELLGTNHVGVGPDTFWGDHAAMYEELGKKRQSRYSDKRSRPSNLPPKFDVFKMRAQTPKNHPHVQGLENPGDFVNIARGLVRDGFSDPEIVKVMGLNALRVIKSCWSR